MTENNVTTSQKISAFEQSMKELFKAEKTIVEQTDNINKLYTDLSKKIETDPQSITQADADALQNIAVSLMKPQINYAPGSTLLKSQLATYGLLSQVAAARSDLFPKNWIEGYIDQANTKELPFTVRKNMYESILDYVERRVKADDKTPISVEGFSKLLNAALFDESIKPMRAWNANPIGSTISHIINKDYKSNYTDPDAQKYYDSISEDQARQLGALEIASDAELYGNKCMIYYACPRLREAIGDFRDYYAYDTANEKYYMASEYASIVDRKNTGKPGIGASIKNGLAGLLNHDH